MLSLNPVLSKVLVVAALGIASPVLAATIYGTLKRGSQPLGAAAVKLTCGTLQSAGQSDPRGNYSLSIATSGSCTLNVDGKAAPVQLGNQPVRYDFEVPAAGNALVQR